MRKTNVIEVCLDALNDKAFNEHSQFGEDGLIEACFNMIGTKNQWCFEVGAGDGEYLSNTKRLRDQGWQAVLIESNLKHVKAMIESHASNETIVDAHIGSNDLSGILESSSVPKDIDLGVIDIDGNDYCVWDNLNDYRPRVLVIEYSPYSGRDNLPGNGYYGQAGINPIKALGASKGYTFVAATYCNAIFVDSKELN